MKWVFTAIFQVLLVLAQPVLAQQPTTPCEEVRSILATNAADLATQVRAVSRENDTLKAKVAEMEKKLANHKEPIEQEKKP